MKFNGLVCPDEMFGDLTDEPFLYAAAAGIPKTFNGASIFFSAGGSICTPGSIKKYTGKITVLIHFVFCVLPLQYSAGLNYRTRCGG